MVEPNSFLVINVSRIGDTLLATPLLRAIKAAHPAARLDVLAHPKRAEILKHLPFISSLGGITKRRAWWRGRLGAQRYDCAIVLGYDEALVRYALRVAKRVVAFRQKNAGLNRRLFHAVEPPAFQSDHAVRMLLKLTAALDIAPAGCRLSYQVHPAEHAWAHRRLSTDLPREAGPLIGLQVASFPTKSYRDWPIESFADLCRRLHDRWPRIHFIVFGGSGDRARATWLTRAVQPMATLYAGRLTLRQTAAIMAETDAYVGVDTGPTHIMSCFDIPLIALYHCYSPSSLIGALDHPCFYPVDHPRPHRCATDVPMAEIAVESVTAAVSRALAGRAFVEQP